MSNTGQAETPMRDHVARFWHYLQTETVRVVLDLKRTVGTEAPDGPVVYWDGSTFSDDVAKAVVADRERLTAENERLRAAIARIDYYYDLNDCDDMKESDAIEIDIKAMRDVHRAFQQLIPQKE